MRKLFVVCGVAVFLLAISQPAAAQGEYDWRLRAQVVNEQISEQDIDFHLTGFGIRLSRRLFGPVAVAGEYGATFGDPFNLDTNNQWVVGGLQVYPYAGEHVEVYGQFLGGWDRLKIGDPPDNSDNSGTIVVGGGLNIYFHRNVGLNFEANYKSTWLFNSQQDFAQFRGGVVFRWGGGY